ncbi:MULTISPECIES: SDR family NAD(P)-dependent oxidoreductase [Dyadobacter]|uniref:SDR family oxidoreductase n=1 Tax=Dyadobacter sediminis TaxID=1493691 RepID=A0A5R9K541_9BACT|nr:SDR family NAD(P)-dependent oxidoreductase [Dyadobacter sediminis]TLU88719.1 SDR family oxidoreductase [Dyadobacter sediminis]GGC14150.1 short-chain dehydrogenase [Dyadobacter sediminis]
MDKRLADNLSLKGKTALITGASQGIGQGIALGLAEYGADILLHYRQDRPEANAVRKDILKLGVRCTLVKADLSKTGSVASIEKQLNVQPDIMVINASLQIPKKWIEVTQQDFNLQMDVNVKSTMLLMQRFVPAMIEKGWGRIITVGSVQQVKPHPAMLVYAASKAAVLNMVQNVAMQLADKGVTVNNVAPGVIGTPRLEQGVPQSDERITKRLETPQGIVGEPSDCAAMVLLLASEAGRFITGQNIFVDGGMSL